MEHKKCFGILFIFLFVNLLGYSQCDIPGGSFEQFDEVSDSLEAITEMTIDGPVYISHDFIPVFRPAFLLFLSLFGELIGQDLVDFSTNFFGQQRFSPGANDTEFGLQLIPDGLFNIADAVHLPFACSAQPTTLRGSFLHVGSANDTAVVIVVFGSDSLLSVLGADDVPNISDPHVDGVGIATFRGGNQEYSTFEIPIDYGEGEVDIDSALIYILTIGDTTFIAEGIPVHYVFDEFSFGDVINATKERIRLADRVTLYPNPTTDYLNIESDHSLDIEYVQIRDISGRIIHHRDLGHRDRIQLNLQQLIPGYYITELITSKGTISKTLIKY